MDNVHCTVQYAIKPLTPTSEPRLTMMITSVTMRLTLTLVVAAACVLIRTSHAFSQSSGIIHVHTSRSLTTTTQLSATEPTKESMEQDIQDMRAQAKERLRALTEQMEGLKHDDDDDKNESRNDENEIVEKLTRQNEQVAANNEGAAPAPAAASTSKATATLFSKATPLDFPQRTSKSNSDQNKDLLDDTRWKIVFNIGRERGTWMTEKWGASGDRLLFQVVVDLTEEPLYERDEFFQGVAGQKKLEIVEAWVFSTGVGAASRGRQPVAVKSQGGYKVLPGKGPAGTDILRLYIELTDKVQSKADSDVYCPAGRVYGTCGYFATPGVLQDRSSGGSERDQPHPKDMLMDEQRRLSRQYKQIEEEQEEDVRLVSWDQMKKMKKLMELRMQLDRVATELQRAREWEPEKSQLRMSQDGRVSLTKEGGVSCNVRKGLASEYHILGKMELASIKHEDDDHDDADN
jgi:hypothetical protein